MRNVRQPFWNRKIPAFMSIFVLVLSMTTILWLSRNTLLFGTKAAAGNTPKNVQITNLSDSLFTVSYTTDDNVVGTINYGKTEEVEQVALDDRDQKTGTPTPHRVHHITMQGLTPKTTYYFSITSGDKTFLEEEELYQVTTIPVLTGSPISQTPIAGKVTLDDGTIPSEGIVYASSETSQVLSALLKPDGSYLLPLTGIRKDDYSAYLSITPTTKLLMGIVNATLRSNITVLASQTNPVPMIILSKEYDFTLGKEPLPTLAADDSASASASPPAFPKEESSFTGSGPEIITPEADEQFKDTQPLFKGHALPNTTIEIIINSQAEIRASVAVDGNGDWEFRPETPLEPGTHKITVKGPDDANVIRILTQSFTVFAEGSQFVEPSGTTSPSPTKTATPTVTMQPTETPTPTIEPTTVVTPTTAVDTSSLTSSPAATRTPLPPAGSSSVLIGFIAILISISIGAILLFAL